MTDQTQVVVAVITVIGVIASSGVIQFFFTRRDQQKEENRKKELDALREEFKAGLDEREDTGRKRYEEHHLSIEKMNLQHQKDFQELKDAIRKLTDNDTKITDSITRIADKQEIMAESLVGQAHDRIILLTDKISDRGAITNKEKATLKSMYNPYHNLGGNGEVQEAYNYSLTLRTVSEEEARKMDIELRGKEYQEMRKAYEEH